MLPPVPDRYAGRPALGMSLGSSKRGQTMRMGDILAGLMEFALQILLSDLHISQGHADVFVAEQLHQGRKADPEPEHFGREGMPKLVQVWT